MELPPTTADYATQQYWEQRYTASSNAYEWFMGYDSFKHILTPLLSPSSRILHLGCGTSTLAHDLYNDGYTHVVNVDYASSVIDSMKVLHASRPTLEWHVADIRSLPFDDVSFDAVLDKGTMDALLCEAHADPWNPSEKVLEDVRREVDQVFRVLKEGGVFVYISFGQPHFRRKLLERIGWHLDIITVGDAFHYFVYILRKSKP